MGYPGSLWVHGINYHEREQDIDKIFKGGNQALDLLKKYNIKFIVMENYQPKEMEVNRSFYDKYPILVENNAYKIHQIR